MKVKLLKNIRKNCHIKISTFYDNKYIVYSKNFDASIEIKNWLFFLEYWGFYVGVNKQQFESYKYERKIRRNKNEFSK